MRLLTAISFFLIIFIKLGSGVTFAQESHGALESPRNVTSDLTWKTILMTGDDQLDVFDNARKALKSELLQMGVTPGNIKELSMNPSERRGGSLPSSVRN